MALPTSVASAGEPNDAGAPAERLTLVVPAGVTAGWALTAQAMRRVLESEGIVREVNIQYVPGDGGLTGLASFVESRRGDGRSLLIGGMVMIGSTVARHDTAALNDLIPVAQLTSDADVVVVPGSSAYHTLDDLLAAMRRNPGGIRWAGGSIGGSGHPTIWQLARATGVEPELMEYASFPNERELAMALASGQLSAGIDGYSELDARIRSGELRGLALISRQPLEGVNIPTFRQLGIASVSIANWCGAFAPPAISSADALELERILDRMVHSRSWATAVKQLHLRGAYLGTAGFSQLMREERTRIVKSEAAASAARHLWLPAQLWQHRLEASLTLLAGVIVLLNMLRSQKASAREREDELRRALREMSQKLELRAREDSPPAFALQVSAPAAPGTDEQRATDAKPSPPGQDVTAAGVGITAQIEREFDRWGLTCAERSVAQLMLKGLRLKEIAGARKTSDRTVRQQAQAIYRKAGLDGRTDLAAYFLESVIVAPTAEQPVRVSSVTVPAARAVKATVAKRKPGQPGLIPLTALAAGRPQ